MADTNYLYYGDQQVDQQALMNKMANGVVQYVQSQPWTRKRKDMFMSAYSDIMNNGLKGMSNNTGQWMVDFGGPIINWDSKSRKEKEMYEEAGYFIQQQMSGLATKPEEEKEEENKKELTKFKNEDFVSSITNRLVNDWFGGNATNYSNQWNDYDKRGENGLRGINQRSGMLATSLRRYLNSLKDDQYDFTDSPFTDINDFKTKIQTAINTLESDNKDLNQIKESLNVIGLDANEWFNNGSGDDYVDENGLVHINEATQKPYTYGQWYNYQNQLNSQKQKAEQEAAEEKQKALDALQVYTSKPHQKLYSFSDLSNKYGDTNSFLNKFKDKQIQDLSQEESDELTSYFYTLNDSDEGRKRLQDLTDEEWEPLKSKLQPLQSQYGYGTIERSKNQFKKVKGLDSIYYDTVQNALVQIGQQGQEPLEDLFSGQNDKKQAEINMNTALKDIPGLSKEMRNELWATGLDILSIANPEALSGSAMALYASHLRDEANPNRGSFEKWLDRGTAALGGIQVAGDALLTGKVGYNLYKLGKLINSSTKVAGAIGSVFALSGVPEAGESLKKLATEGVGSMTPKDVQNLAYGFMALMGVKAFATARNKQVTARQANPTVTEHNVTIKDSKGQSHEVKIDAETANQVQQIRTLGKKKADVDSEILNIPKMRESIQKYNESNPTKKLELEGASVQNNSKSVSGRSGRNKIVQSKQVKDPNAPQYSPVGTNYWLNPGYLLPWQREVWSQPELQPSSKGFVERIKNFWNPEPTPVNSNRTSTDGQSIREKVSTNDIIPEKFDAKDPKINPSLYHNPAQKNPNAPKISEVREGMQQWKDNNKGLFSTNKLTSGEYTVNGSRIQVVEQTDGTFNILFKGNHIGNYRNQKDLQKQIFNIIKQQRRPDLSKPAEISYKEIAKILKDLKRKGWLKQGGKITDTQIDNFLKQYKI